MINVLVVSAEPRLLEAVQSNLDDGATIRSAPTGLQAQDILFQETVRLVFLDFEVVKETAAEVLVSIDNIVQKEQGIAVLLCRRASQEAAALRDRFASIEAGIDLSRGRPEFDERVRAAYQKIRSIEDLSLSTDRLIRHEVDLAVPENGSLLDFPLARLLYTIWQRKETGRLTLHYSTHELVFGFHQGELLNTPDYSPRSELLGAFTWSHGKYEFDAADIAGVTVPVIDVIAEGCRDHIRQRAITEMMTPVMRRYPVKTNLWEERRDQLADFDVLAELMDRIDGSTNWENALSSLGQRVSHGFRAAFFAIQLDLAHTVQQPGLVGIAVQYSREVRRARQAVDQAEVEKTKAFKASSGSGRSEIERELGVHLSKMRHMTPHEIFGVWEGCGRKVVQDRFYILVKEHHPDVYGGNTTGNVRSLAQDIFILIKNSYQELLGIENAQTVPPPETKQTPGRQRVETPRLASPISVGSHVSEVSEASVVVEDDEPIDVKSKLSQLSGFRKKQRHRERLRSYQDRTSTPSEAEVDEERLDTPINEPEPEPEPEPDPQSERQAKLDHLLKRAQAAGHPDANPSKDFWDKGFHAYKEGRNRDALEFFQRAYERDPEDGPNMTFYAHLMQLNDQTRAAEAEEMLRAALQSGNRQSAPDACLFLAHAIKTQGRLDEALTFYKRALRLNPSSREAEREVRLAELRDPDRKSSDAGKMLKNLFKK